MKLKTSVGTLPFRHGDTVDSAWFCWKRDRIFHNQTREISTLKIRNICDGL